MTLRIRWECDWWLAGFSNTVSSRPRDRGTSWWDRVRSIIALPLNTFFGFLSRETVFIAPLIEEPTKAAGVIFLALSYPYVIASKARGLILGGLAGLGFAFTENLFYATVPGTDVVARALLPVPMHVMASGIVGLGFVYLAQTRVPRMKRVTLTTIVIHRGTICPRQT